MIKKISKTLIGLMSILVVSCTTQQANVNVIDNDIYTGNETIKYLADGVADRIFFATNKYNISTRGSETLLKQVTYLKNNPNLNVTLEGHADERGTREYNLALGEKRANAVKDYLIANSISSSRIKVVSYGKERPANPASNAIAWSQNRRTVTVKIN
ncbi:OmpA Outer membrane protein and related peptidoglycan-associated (lipo)proteins [Candidatus Pelagibacterales bacterium]|jgi:peptidoglycan-associated lipoprotein